MKILKSKYEDRFEEICNCFDMFNRDFQEEQAYQILEEEHGKDIYTVKLD